MKKAEGQNKEVPNLEKLYHSFFTQFQAPETKAFLHFFEYIQIKSYSEAICETIGSVMKLAVDKGRNLNPVYFSQEIMMRVNLPPLHILTQKMIPASIGNFRKNAEHNSSMPIDMFI